MSTLILGDSAYISTSLFAFDDVVIVPFFPRHSKRSPKTNTSQVYFRKQRFALTTSQPRKFPNAFTRYILAVARHLGSQIAPLLDCCKVYKHDLDKRTRSRWSATQSTSRQNVHEPGKTWAFIVYLLVFNPLTTECSHFLAADTLATRPNER